MWKKTRLLFFTAALAIVVCGPSAVASASAATSNGVAPNAHPLVEMNHKTWTARDGAPQGVRSLALGPDGTLWIGSEGGLFNFDGRTFKPFRPASGEPEVPGGPVYAMCFARDGSLWIATVQGAARIVDGHVTLHPIADDQPIGTVLMIRAASDGSVWATGRSSFVRFGADGSAHMQATPLAISAKELGGLFIDSTNTLWLGQGGKLYRRPLDEAAYTLTEAGADFLFAFDETSDGTIWIGDYDSEHRSGRYQRVDRTGKVLATLPLDKTPSGIVTLPDQSIVVSTQFYGLRHFGSPAAKGGDAAALERTDVFTHAEGLSSDAPRAMVNDADGNIWIGGRRGIDRLRPAQLTPLISDDPIGPWSVCANPQGEVWIASNHAQLYKVANGVRKTFQNPGDYYLIACGNDGELWLADGKGLWNMHGDELRFMEQIPGAGAYGLNQIAIAPGHVLYVSAALPTNVAGLWQFKEGRWTHFSGEGVLKKGGFTVYVDSKNRVWSGHRDGFVARPLEDGLLFSSGKPGLGNVFALKETGLGMFAAGSNGLAVLKGDAFQMLSFADAGVARGVDDIVEAPDGDLWLNASRGVVHVRVREIRSALADPEHAMEADLVTEGEFVGPVPLQVRASAARDVDGRLWFASLNGVFHLDPAHIDPKTRPPVVSVRSMTVDGNAVSASAPIGPEPQTLAIQYLGVNLTTPEAVVYKYRLDGLDDGWQEVGHRTEAIYTHLKPGTYTFEVAASNGDGEWTAPVSSASFMVRPSFYQTAWFALLCAAAAVLGLLGLFALRLRAVARGIRARAEERADERIRIARELHDTLLQGIQGLLLNFHVAAQKIAPDNESKQMLEHALSTADRIIIEGRNRVSSLRSDHLTDAELIGSIETIGSDLMPAQDVQFRATRSGVAATLHAHVADEVFYIAREALANAFRHSGASQIGVELRYGTRFFRLVCEDNGRGFDPDVVQMAGHWGLKGMAERAAKLGGRMICASRPGKGTRIDLTLPTYRAYRHGSRLMYYLRALNWRAESVERQVAQLQ